MCLLPDGYSFCCLCACARNFCAEVCRPPPMAAPSQKSAMPLHLAQIAHIVRLICDARLPLHLGRKTFPPLDDAGLRVASVRVFPEVESDVTAYLSHFRWAAPLLSPWQPLMFISDIYCRISAQYRRAVMTRSPPLIRLATTSRAVNRCPPSSCRLRLLLLPLAVGCAWCGTRR